MQINMENIGMIAIKHLQIIQNSALKNLKGVDTSLIK